jgi:hypothetical protein
VCYAASTGTIGDEPDLSWIHIHQDLLDFLLSSKTNSLKKSFKNRKPSTLIQQQKKNKSDEQIYAEFIDAHASKQIDKAVAQSIC